MTTAKIDSLNIKNFKGLKQARIRSEKRMILIDGKNGAGKSSVLDAILAALGGKKAICSEPLRRGEANGYIECEAGGFKVVRKFREDGKTSVSIKSEDGGKFGQARLDEMFSSIGPDPVAFLNSKPADQVKIAKDVLGIDFSDLDEKRKSFFDARTDFNRDAKKLEAQLEGMPFHEDAPKDEVFASEFFEHLKEAQEHNFFGEQLKDRIKDLGGEIEAKNETVERLRRELNEAELELSEKMKLREKRRKELEGYEFKDTESLEAEIQSADETNKKVRENNARANAEGELAKAQESADDLTRKLEKIDADKAEMIKGAEFPIDNLSIGDGELLLNDIPFNQASSAQKIRVSVAMSLAMNPELRVLMIRDGSLLDEDSLKMVSDLAEEMDAQIWIERVGEDDEGAILIVDGEVAEKQTA